MLLLLVFCGLVAVTIGQEGARPGCCAPRQWEGNVNERFSLATPFSESRFVSFGVRTAFDSVNGMLRQDVRYHVEGVQPPLTFIYNFKRGEVYRIDQASKSCRVYSTSSQLARICIPRTADDFGSFYYGAGRNTFYVSNFGFSLNRLYVSASVSRSGCLPVEDILYGGYLFGYYIGDVGFGNMTRGIRDPSVFDVPSACEQTNLHFEDLDEPPMNSFLFQHLNRRLLETN